MAQESWDLIFLTAASRLDHTASSARRSCESSAHFLTLKTVAAVRIVVAVAKSAPVPRPFRNLSRAAAVGIHHEFIVFVALSIVVCATPAVGGKDGPMAKISPELRALYQAYVAAGGGRTPFTSRDPLVPVIDDRVVIDASASGDVAALKADLTTLGMIGAVSAGRIVSGQLPISAIGSLSSLSTLQFAWPAAAATNRGAVGPSH